jgi:hypothetical protein
VQYSGNIVHDTVSAGDLSLLGQQICVTNSSGLQPAFATETHVKRYLSKRGEVIYGVCGIGPDSSVRERGMNRTGGFLDRFASIYNSSRSYSINMGPSSSDPNGPAGEILLGAVDPTRFSGPLVPDTLYEPEILGYYSLAAPELSLLLPGQEIPLPFGEQTYCLFDSGTALSRFPSSVTALIANALSGTNPTDNNVITADCSLLTNVTLRHTFASSLTGRPLTIDQPLAEYLQNWGDAPATEGQCQLPIEQSNSDCLLGQFFLQQVYFVVNNDMGQMAMARIGEGMGMGGSKQAIPRDGDIPFADYYQYRPTSIAPTGISSARSRSTGSGMPVSRSGSVSSPGWSSLAGVAVNVNVDSSSWTSTSKGDQDGVYGPSETIRVSSHLDYTYIEGDIDYDVYTEVVVEYPLSDSATEGSGSNPNAGDDSEQCDEEGWQDCDCEEVEEPVVVELEEDCDCDTVRKTLMSNT